MMKSQKGFPYYWPFVRGIHQSLLDSFLKGPVVRSFDVSSVDNFNKLLNKQSSCHWFRMALMLTWHHCHTSSQCISWATQLAISKIYSLLSFRIAFYETKTVTAGQRFSRRCDSYSAMVWSFVYRVASWNRRLAINTLYQVRNEKALVDETRTRLRL